MCPLGRSIDQKTKHQILDMDIGIAKKLIDEVSKFGFFKPRAHFSGGGEPLLYRQFVQLASYCREKKINWSMTTNGYTLNKFYKQIVDSNCRNINISIHGYSHVHDNVVGVKGSFDKVVSNLNVLDEYKKARNTILPRIALNCVINKKNVEYLYDILNTFKDLPVHSITFQHLIFTPEDLEDTEKRVPKSKEELETVKRFIEYVENNQFSLPIQFFPSIKTKDIFHYYNDFDYPFERTCTFPWHVLRLRPEGSVTTCNGLELGNIRNEKLTGMWNSHKNNQFRKKLKKSGISRSCYRCCHRNYY
jgi:MoaA/NifB/PqqE/SkfB family radical SAM enzyme